MVNLLGEEIFVNIYLHATNILTVRCFMLIGYARVSTDNQNLDLQKDALAHSGCYRIMDDRLNCAKTERPVLKSALDYARPCIYGTDEEKIGDSRCLTICSVEIFSLAMHDRVLTIFLVCSCNKHVVNP
jgi:hypothetical protein